MANTSQSLRERVQQILDGIESPSLQVHSVRKLQALWAGYGQALEVVCGSDAGGGPATRLVIKEVVPPAGSGTSHHRKLASYLSEAAFYTSVAPQLLARGAPPLATPLLVQAWPESGRVVLVLTDLRTNYPNSIGSLDLEHAKAGLTWLAELHVRQRLACFSVRYCACPDLGQTSLHAVIIGAGGILGARAAGRAVARGLLLAFGDEAGGASRH